MNDEQLIALANEGLSATKISDRTGLSVWKVYQHLRRLTTEGKLKHHTERKIPARVKAQGRKPAVAFAIERQGLTIGVASDIVMGLDTEQLKWLAKTVPEGSTVVDFCCALLRDLYDEMTC